MKKAACFALLSLVIVSAVAAAGPGPALRVKVTVLVANVRSAPSSEAPVILTAESGRIFDVIEKAGAWYLVALPENKKGYLSATIVVEIDESGKPVPPPPPAPTPSPSQGPAEAPAPPAPPGKPLPRVEFGLFGGFGSSLKMGPSNYTGNWQYDLLVDVSESTDITVPGKGGLFYGGSFTYFVSPNFGIQVSAGSLSPAIATTSAFAFNWTWDPSVNLGGFGRDASWTGASSLSTSVFSLDAVGRFGEGPLTYAVFAGLSLFRCSFQASGTVGYGVSLETQVGDAVYQNVDALPIPAEIPLTSWTSVGFNLGLGVSYQLSSFLALSVEARYYDGGVRNLNWTFTPGSYDGLFFDTIKKLAITAEDTSYIAAYTVPLPVNPSFVQISAGLKITF